MPYIKRKKKKDINAFFVRPCYSHALSQRCFWNKIEFLFPDEHVLIYSEIIITEEGLLYIVLYIIQQIYFNILHTELFCEIWVLKQ